MLLLIFEYFLFQQCNCISAAYHGSAMACGYTGANCGDVLGFAMYHEEARTQRTWYRQGADRIQFETSGMSFIPFVF